MKINRGGSPAFRSNNSSRAKRMAMYDAQPPEIREYIRNAPLAISVSKIVPKEYTSWALEVLKQEREAKMPESTLRTYGPDHPQARKLTPDEELLASVGLL